MDKREEQVGRLLRAAAAAPETAPSEVPFGFDTRVIATWRADRRDGSADGWEFTRIFRRVAVSAALVTICASGAAFWQFQQNDDLDDFNGNAYAIADTVIEAGAFQ